MPLEGCTVNPDTNTISVAITHFTTFAVLAYTCPVAFDASDLSIIPTEVDIGEGVTISILVANTGDLEGAYQVIFNIDDEVEDTKDITLAGGASQRVTFVTDKDMAGSYPVDVNGLTGSFVVKPAPVESPTTPPVEPVEQPTVAPEVPPAKPINWSVLGGVIAGCVIVAAVISLVVRRQRRVLS